MKAFSQLYVYCILLGLHFYARNPRKLEKFVKNYRSVSLSFLNESSSLDLTLASAFPPKS
jgi:hypothetical protein